MWNLRRSLLLLGWNRPVVGFYQSYPFNNITKKDTKITPETDPVDLIERCTGLHSWSWNQCLSTKLTWDDDDVGLVGDALVPVLLRDEHHPVLGGRHLPQHLPWSKHACWGEAGGESNWPTVSQHCQLDCLASEAAPHHSLMPTNAWRPNWISDSIIQTPTLLNIPSILDFIFMVHILDGYSEWAHQCQNWHESLSLDFCNPFENMSFRFLSYIPTSKIV